MGPTAAVMHLQRMHLFRLLCLCYAWAWSKFAFSPRFFQSSQSEVTFPLIFEALYLPTPHPPPPTSASAFSVWRSFSHVCDHPPFCPSFWSLFIYLLLSPFLCPPFSLALGYSYNIRECLEAYFHSHSLPPSLSLSFSPSLYFAISFLPRCI